MNDGGSDLLPPAGGSSSAESPYHMSLSLNILNHLGINLYSNNPAVLSEVVANAWDADASNVRITLDAKSARIIVADDGAGMTLDEINSRFLHVGYQRRNDPATRTSPSGRQVMGRKGIGKLSLFSIAKKVQIETAKSGQKNKLMMDLDQIDAAIKAADPAKQTVYRPEPMSADSIDFEHGTRITLTNLKRNLNQTAPYLRRRLARRFSILGPANNFRIFIGDTEVDPADAEQLRLAQYLWTYGSEADHSHYQSLATKADQKQPRPDRIINGGLVRGWIATAFQAGQLRESETNDDLNRITVMVRGKLAQEDILDEFNEGGIYRSYVFGELHADFLDLDDEDDIATSSRQKIREDDPRYQQLLDFVKGELQNIQNSWTDFRNEAGTKKALEDPNILAWFETLKGDTKKKAKSLFGRINQLTIDDEKQRRQLFAHGVLAFETMRHRDNLDALTEVNTSDLGALIQLFNDSTDLEAALYHRIVSGRLAIIEKLDQLVDEDAKEKFLHGHLFDHLWLLDPGWERAVEPHMEISMKKAFNEIADKLDPEEAASRLDIRYQRTSGVHVIIELKRASVITTTDKLSAQIKKYRNALRKSLRDAGKENEGVVVICVVGRDLKDWSEIDGRQESAEQLQAIGTRVVKYEELLSNARHAYSEYLANEEQVGRVQKILAGLEDSFG